MISGSDNVRDEERRRVATDIIVPNYVSSTFTALKASLSASKDVVCTPFFGSVRAYLDAEYYTYAKNIWRFKPCYISDMGKVIPSSVLWTRLFGLLLQVYVRVYEY